MSHTPKTKRVTISSLYKKKQENKKISILTAYDYFMASLLDQAGLDCLLVGDSAANVIHGHTSTLAATMDMMLLHTAAVSRGTQRAMVIADMPFLSFQTSAEDAIRNAGLFLRDGGAHAVKMEGGLEMIPTIKRVIESGIPVMGHIGLTPQSINRFGGPRVQGRDAYSADYLKESALALEDAGCFACVLELVRTDVAKDVTDSLKTMATIGIGAGPYCDGQVLVV
ncbi:3-methyl-2-oxobutanoate hydroxymethyltransferase, partial [candidate division GN15 bacterium]|nr:3-methyl-2-oxobutanoate hydroxymethyltransferase [candidate division GN15 bacterium]